MWVGAVRKKSARCSISSDRNQCEPAIAIETFVQVKAAFRRVPTATATSRKPAKCFPWYY